MLKRRKNYLPTLVLILILWFLLALMIFLIEPELIKDVIIPGLYLPFFGLFFPAVFLSLAIILNNSQRGFLISLGLTAILILKIYRLDNWLNFILVGGILITVDRYLSS